MNCVNNIQSKCLITNVLKIIYKQNGANIEISMHQYVVFQTDSKRKIFYKYYNISDEEEHIELNN